MERHCIFLEAACKSLYRQPKTILLPSVFYSQRYLVSNSHLLGLVLAVWENDSSPPIPAPRTDFWRILLYKWNQKFLRKYPRWMWDSFFLPDSYRTPNHAVFGIYSLCGHFLGKFTLDEKMHPAHIANKNLLCSLPFRNFVLLFKLLFHLFNIPFITFIKLI